MKAKRFLSAALVGIWTFVWASLATAAFDSSSTGADGAFNPTSSTELQIPESGVFNFTTVNIPSGVTITFKKNSINTPVTILATGDVTIAGTINLNGSSATGIYPGIGGPGGYGGGHGGIVGGDGGKGLGPGGGGYGYFAQGWCYAGGGGGGFGSGGGGSYCSIPGGVTYSNNNILPLAGGSGGGGGRGYSSVSSAGGGGGGAILIASSGSVNITGNVYANGGGGGVCGSGSGSGGGGSGGAIKIVANKIMGNGTLQAGGGSGGGGSCYYYGYGGGGGNGRIRLETYDLQRSASTSPGYTLGFPDTVSTSNIPVLKISSIGGISVPTVVSASFSEPDIIFPTNVTNPVAIGITASYIPLGTTIMVTAAPQFGADTTVKATGLAGTLESSSATADITLSKDYPSVITLTATYTVQLASNKAPIYADGEKVVKMRVASVMGGKSTLTYITESGKEVEARL